MGAQQSFYRAFIDEEISKKSTGTKYTIKMETEEQDTQLWFVEKNLEELHEFRLALCRKYPNIPFNLPLIQLIGKPSKSEKDNNRAQVLGFLQEIVRRTDVMTSNEASNFFQLQERLQLMPPEENVILMNRQFPITNFIYNKESQYLIYVETDLDEASQVAKQASNQKLCCKGQERLLTKPVSSIYIASVQPSSSDPYDFLPNGSKFENSVFTAQFSKQITSFVWDQEQRRLAIGLNDGKIVIHQILDQKTNEEKISQTNWQNIISSLDYEQKHVFQCGDKPIVALEIDSSLNIIIVASKNQGIFVYNIANETTLPVHDKKIDEEDITCMEYDKEQKYVYVSTNSGIISVLQFNQNQLIPINTFSASIESGVKSMYFHKESKFLFAASQDKLVHLFEEVKDSSSPFKVIQYEGKAKGCQIAFNKQNKDVYVADTIGNITVWGFDSKVPKYVWTAHKKAILKMQFFPEQNVLITTSKDKHMKLFVLKDKWIPESWAKCLSDKSAI